MSPLRGKPGRAVTALMAGLLTFAGGASAVMTGSVPLDIPDMPLFLTSTGVPPNIVLTLDDSGSMSRAFTPDLCGNPDGICNSDEYSKLTPRYLKSSHYNPLYYNPAVTYSIPTNVVVNPAPTFQAAYINGFETGRGTVDLSANYRPSAGLYLSRSTEDGVYYRYMDHYAGDVTEPGPLGPPWTTHSDQGAMIGVNSGDNAPYFVINDFGNIDGSASGNNPGTNIVSVQVQGQASAATRIGNFTLPCKNTNDPGEANRYYTNLSGSTLTLCFRDTGTMYGKQVTVTHRTGGTVSQVPIDQDEGGPAYYYVFDSSNAGCTAVLANQSKDNDCYDIKMVGATSGPGDTDERQNFANWYSFYRTRNLATVSAAAIAFGTLPETARVAWQALNSCRGNASTLVTADCEGWESTNPNFSNAIKPFSGSHKSNFYKWLFRLKTRTSTPLPDAMERAGEYFSTSGNNSPYDNDLSSADAEEYSCRKNFHVMMTDGIWNSAVDGYDNYDSTGHDLPDGNQYTSRRPYSDDNSNSLADIAFKYWATDLRDDLDDKVATQVADASGSEATQYFNARNDPASWQHMVNFTLGLGLTPFIASTGLTWGGSTYLGSFPEIAGGTKSWPATSSSGVNGNVADLWHAAIDSRGKFWSAEDPATLVSAFQEIVDTVSTTASSGGGAGLISNTTQVDQEGTVIFEAKFNADWSGRLFARPVQGDFSLGNAYWDAGQLIPAPYLRNIFTMNDMDGELQAEELSTCSGALADALNRDAQGVEDGLCSKRLSWFRGDGKIARATWADFSAATNTVTATFTVNRHGFVVGDSVAVSGVTVLEDPAPAKSYDGTFVVTAADENTFRVRLDSAPGGPGTYASGGRVRYSQFRDRPNSVLGDIMNSDPVYAHQEDFGFGGSPTLVGKDEYERFLKDDSYPDGKSGRPPVIYVGANDGMLHGFQADVGMPGSGGEVLAYVPNGVYTNLSKLTDPLYAHRFYVDGPISVRDAYIDGAWRTYLVGGLGAGGKSVFALDVSDPDGFSAEDVKWELSDSEDLGLTYSKPQIAPITSRDWAVIFGNGYNSANGKAYLYVVDLGDPASVAKIATDDTVSNGLSTPYLHDSDGDKVVDVIYAGDLQGRLWKFVNSGGVWSVGNDGDPLFTARNAHGEVQPITSQPKVAVNTAESGVLVYFGTGSYLTTNDLKANEETGVETFDDTQSFYAIWDKPRATGTVTREDLEGHRIESEVEINEFTVRTTSDGDLDWALDRGWYLDLPETPDKPSERVVSTPIVMEFTDPSVPDRVLFVTNTPAADPCSRGGTTWLMELDLLTGDPTPTSVFDLSGDGEFSADDNVGGGNAGGGSGGVDTGGGDGGTGDDTEGVPPSGVALPEGYGIAGEPLLLTTEDGDIVKEFSGTTGMSGTADGPLQRGEPPPEPESGTETPPVRIYWKQIL